MSTSVDAALLQDYDELLRNATITSLMDGITLDSATNKPTALTVSATRCKCANAHGNGAEKMLYIGARTALAQFIDRYFFDPSVCARLSDSVYYEKLCGMSKLLVAAMLVERWYSQNGSHRPLTNDAIPQSYARMAACLARAQACWDTIQLENRAQHNALCVAGSEFTRYYTTED